MKTELLLTRPVTAFRDRGPTKGRRAAFPPPLQSLAWFADTPGFLTSIAPKVRTLRRTRSRDQFWDPTGIMAVSSSMMSSDGP